MLRLSVFSTLLLSSAALADVPEVVTDIAPIHGLVARVMGELGAPELLVEPGASPHGYALRPSQAAGLQRADLVVMMGHELTPWLEGPVAQLATGAVVMELLDTQGTTVLSAREVAAFDPDDHQEHDHDHAHEGADPHAWLDPRNAVAWLASIADALAELDPANAETYRENAAGGSAEIAAAQADAADRLAPLAEQPYVVFHDAFQYFEARFGLAGVGAISLSDATPPSAARVAEIRALVEAEGVVCAFSEPQFNPAILDTVTQGTGARLGTVDPVGATLSTGPGFYPALIAAITSEVAACLGGE
jgi:zinc transport system substrate-binding protein